MKALPTVINNAATAKVGVTRESLQSALNALKKGDWNIQGSTGAESYSLAVDTTHFDAVKAIFEKAGVICLRENIPQEKPEAPTFNVKLTAVQHRNVIKLRAEDLAVPTHTL
jgi:hypothetical protein